VRGDDSIIWTVEFRNGTVKRFEFPVRTTPEGSADAYGTHGDASLDDISDHGTLFTKRTHSCDTSQFIES
ncbi:MAG: adenylyl-sulfate reductase subunit beta, partial [Gammaproteobacteria bacterium]|nr:adenylyl-sulfate reductase subunit beta [Gammaproteobacteria bacterium]